MRGLGSREPSAGASRRLGRDAVRPYGVAHSGKDDPQAVARAKTWRALLHRVAGGGQRVAHHESRPPEERHLEAQPPARVPDETPTLHEQGSGARRFEGQQGAQSRAVFAAQELLGVHREARQILAR